MLFQGTQMHIATFIFVSIEIVILFYLITYRLARPDDKITALNIVLIFLLVTYNITGGLLPDEHLPGSFFIQYSIAYGTGFITPCFFPYYVYKVFSLERMRFHAYTGVYLFLILPYLLFVIVFALTNKLEVAKNLLILPVVYALWVIISMIKAISYKYKNDFSSKEPKEEMTVLLLSLSPWVGLPAIDFFNMGQATEACVTNFGFLSLFALQMKRHIKTVRTEHERLIASEYQLLNWNSRLKREVEKRTEELKIINEQRTNTFVNLAHETKTPLTLINNYLEEYISRNEHSHELNIVKNNLDKLSADIANLFDLEKFDKGFSVYNHELISNFSEMLKDSVILFKQYGDRNRIKIKANIEDDIFIKADPVSISRIINNLVENAIKFSKKSSEIEIILKSGSDKIYFSIKDYGVGIPVQMQQKVFEPYYQISNQKNSTQGMGLGLPIVRKVVEDLSGEIRVISNPKITLGTEMFVTLNSYTKLFNDAVYDKDIPQKFAFSKSELKIEDALYEDDKLTIFVIEDNIAMLHYLIKKLREKYNAYAAINGNDALHKMKALPVLPDLIITDIMMDKVDGYEFAKIISKNGTAYAHIPFIFLSAKATVNDMLQGLKLGAIDYVPKPFSISILLQKIDSILLNSGIQKKVIWDKAFIILNSNKNTPIENISNKFEQNFELYHLTVRERIIAKLICQGQKYKDIADTLFIAERTVTKHAQNIFKKAQVSNKIELINKLEFS